MWFFVFRLPNGRPKLAIHTHLARIERLHPLESIADSFAERKLPKSVIGVRKHFKPMIQIDGSLYPDREPPEALATLEERIDFIARLCSALDFGLLPES